MLCSHFLSCEKEYVKKEGLDRKHTTSLTKFFCNFHGKKNISVIYFCSTIPLRSKDAEDIYDVLVMIAYNYPICCDVSNLLQ